MNPHRYPGLLDRLAAEYALGTLRGGSRRRLESLALNDKVIQRSIELWRTRIETIAELTPGQRPPDSVWHAIEARIEAQRGPQTNAQTGLHPQIRPQTAARPATVRQDTGERVVRWFESLNFWRGWAFVASAAALVALGIALRPLLPTEAPAGGANGARIGYVAVLHDQTSQQSTLLITWDDAHSTLTLDKLSRYPLQSNQALQLWGLPAQGNPVSLGVIHADAHYSVQLPERPQNYPVLSVSVEPSGGSPNPNGPTGPVVYTGKLVPTT